MDLDQFQFEHTVGGSLFSLLLLLVALWIAKWQRFFSLPPPFKSIPVNFLQTLGAFLTYLFVGFIILPVLLVFIAILATGEVSAIKTLSNFWGGWIQVASLYGLFLLLTLYCFLIRGQTRRFIFWGNGERSLIRFWRGVGMGIVGWCISFPCVLIVGLCARYISIWIWGQADIEQVAVKQLKLTMGIPYLFGLMASKSRVLFRK